MFELQTYTWVDGWINSSSTEDEQGNTIPLVFDTREKAQEELDDMRDEIERQILSGERDADEGYDWEGEWRIVEVERDNLQPLRDLADQWRRDLPHMDNDAANVTQTCLDELIEVLNTLVANACDCTAGVDHVHTEGRSYAISPKA